MIHILFYAPYPASKTTIEEVFLERPDQDEITYEVVHDTFNNPLESIQADAVISRGFTAHAMEKLNIPYAELKTNGYDVIRAVDSCLQSYAPRKIAFVAAFNMIYGAENMRSVYDDISFASYPIIDETMLEEKVKLAIEEGADAIIGGYTSVKTAEQYHIPGVMIESGKEAINNAISEAKSAVILARYERKKSNEIANIMNYSFQGIISTDTQGMITLANKYCYSTIKNIHSSLIGKDIRTLFPFLEVESVIEDGKRLLSYLYTYEGIQLMINCVPIEMDSYNAGCVVTFQNATQIQADEGKIRKKMHKAGFTARYTFSNILHWDAVMEPVVSMASDFSDSDSSILIHGETGTGKELFAQSIHNASRRRNKPFVAINCAALPEDILESELFGYVEGAFTGASRGGKMGFFEIAHEGTIFLDEIGDISPKLQSRLLRVLQEREIIRLGNDTVIPIDVRIISASNKNLKEEVRRGNFRQDLLYRLDVLELNIPPLRRRTRDIQPLLEHFIQYEHQRTGCELEEITSSAMEALIHYDWPGNIREVRNFAERICTLCHKKEAGLEHVCQALPDVVGCRPGDEPRNLSPYSPEADERETIIRALKMHHNKRTDTAAYLNIDKSTLWRKMKKYNLL